MKIKITCEGNRTINLKDLENFQSDNFKTLSDENFKKLKDSIIKHGFSFPLYCWKDKNVIVDGHNRLKALKVLKSEGYEIESLPVIDVEAKDKKELAEKLLLLNSKYAKITEEGFYDFLNTFDLTFEEVDFEIDIPELNFVTDEYDDDFELPNEEKSPFQQLTFTLSDKQADFIKSKLEEIKKTDKYKNCETFGNENSNGNALYSFFV